MRTLIGRIFNTLESGNLIAASFKPVIQARMVQSGYQEAARMASRPFKGRSVDLRSDTITKPDEEMREAMKNAEVGDDVYGEDPTIKRLQDEAALYLGKEAALFVPSGTMSNLIALLVHCTRRGSEAIVGDQSHILHYEQAGAAQFGGINLRPVATLPDGTFSLEEVKQKLRNASDPHHPISTLICIENTHNRCGGRVLPLDWIDKVGRFAKEHGLPLHMDGARLFNAVVSTGVSAARIVEACDSISICLSKGLGAPVGSLVVGSKPFITEALRFRKALGGGMRQAGVLAAAGLLALEKGPERMKKDHEHAKHLAQAINNCGGDSVTVDLSTVDSNMIMAQCTGSVTPALLCERLALCPETEVQELGQEIRILGYPMTSTNARFVLHRDISADDVTAAEKKLQYVLRELKSV